MLMMGNALSNLFWRFLAYQVDRAVWRRYLDFQIYSGDSLSYPNSQRWKVDIILSNLFWRFPIAQARKLKAKIERLQTFKSILEIRALYEYSFMKREVVFQIYSGDSAGTVGLLGLGAPLGSFKSILEIHVTLDPSNFGSI